MSSRNPSPIDEPSPGLDGPKATSPGPRPSVATHGQLVDAQFRGGLIRFRNFVTLAFGGGLLVGAPLAAADRIGGSLGIMAATVVFGSLATLLLAVRRRFARWHREAEEANEAVEILKDRIGALNHDG